MCTHLPGSVYVKMKITYFKIQNVAFIGFLANKEDICTINAICLFNLYQIHGSYNGSIYLLFFPYNRTHFEGRGREQAKCSLGPQAIKYYNKIHNLLLMPIYCYKHKILTCRHESLFVMLKFPFVPCTHACYLGFILFLNLQAGGNSRRIRFNCEHQWQNFTLTMLLFIPSLNENYFLACTLSTPIKYERLYNQK